MNMEKFVLVYCHRRDDLIQNFQCAIYDTFESVQKAMRISAEKFANEYENDSTCVVSLEDLVGDSLLDYSIMDNSIVIVDDNKYSNHHNVWNWEIITSCDKIEVEI